jgi:hypothetical protein
MAGGGTSLRAKEALTTTVGLNRFEFRADWIFGALVVVLVAYGALRLSAPDGRGERVGAVVLGVAAAMYLVSFADGLGFVPGMLSASPLAAAGVAIGWSVRRWRMVGIVALVALPMVWMFQFIGGANPQWGGRYVLVSGTLLVVGAAVLLPLLGRAARIGLVAIAVLVTASGVAWLSQRSHHVADAMQAIEVSDGSVVVSREAHVLREGGAFYDPDDRWLTATSGRDLARAAEIASAVGAPSMRLLAVHGRSFPRTVSGWERGGRRQVEFLPGLRLDVVTYTPPAGA